MGIYFKGRNSRYMTKYWFESNNALLSFFFPIIVDFFTFLLYNKYNEKERN